MPATITPIRGGTLALAFDHIMAALPLEHRPEAVNYLVQTAERCGITGEALRRPLTPEDFAKVRGFFAAIVDGLDAAKGAR
jgi:hypothetical protein